VSSSKYYLVILNDFTHYLWTIALNLKFDTFATFSNFLLMLLLQFNSTVKVIQCDSGREFDNSSTRTFLLSKGTQMRMSCPYTSPQNGKYEHIICSINNIICKLLIQASLVMSYWVEGLNNIVLSHHSVSAEPSPHKDDQCCMSSSLSSYLHPHTSSSVSSVAHVTLTLLPPCHISLPLGPPDVSFLATPSTIKVINVLTSPQICLSSCGF
jgi:hypothetical protein